MTPTLRQRLALRAPYLRLYLDAQRTIAALRADVERLELELAIERARLGLVTKQRDRYAKTLTAELAGTSGWSQADEALMGAWLQGEQMP